MLPSHCPKLGIRERCQAAFDKGVECILNTQIIVDGKPTVWCAQHDEQTLQPASARAYELPSFSGAESVGIVQLLMNIDHPSQRVIDAVKGAVELRGNGELIKREALEDIGGWNNYTITDDLDMSTRLHIKGWDVRFCYDAIVYEEGIMYLIPLYRQRRRWLEGTIRRYLEYFGDILTSKKMSLRVRLDMIAYISEFIMPAWFIIEIAILLMKIIIKDAPAYILFSSIIMGCIIGLGFMLACRYSLRRYDKMSRLDALIQSVLTSVYLLLIWFPLVLFIGTKILFMKKDMNWGKTAHGLIQHEHAIQRAKAKIKQAKDELKKLLKM